MKKKYRENTRITESKQLQRYKYIFSRFAVLIKFSRHSGNVSFRRSTSRRSRYLVKYVYSMKSDSSSNKPPCTRVKHWYLVLSDRRCRFTLASWQQSIDSSSLPSRNKNRPEGPRCGLQTVKSKCSNNKTSEISNVTDRRCLRYKTFCLLFCILLTRDLRKSASIHVRGTVRP